MFTSWHRDKLQLFTNMNLQIWIDESWNCIHHDNPIETIGGFSSFETISEIGRLTSKHLYRKLQLFYHWNILKNIALKRSVQKKNNYTYQSTHRSTHRLTHGIWYGIWCTVGASGIKLDEMGHLFLKFGEKSDLLVEMLLGI